MAIKTPLLVTGGVFALGDVLVVIPAPSLLSSDDMDGLFVTGLGVGAGGTGDTGEGIAAVGMVSTLFCSICCNR